MIARTIIKAQSFCKHGFCSMANTTLKTISECNPRDLIKGSMFMTHTRSANTWNKILPHRRDYSSGFIHHIKPVTKQSQVSKLSVGEYAVLIIKSVSSAYLIVTYISDTSILYGESMQPTFEGNGDIVLTDRTIQWRGSLERGDIIIVQSPADNSRFVCKRIKGLEGDRISYKDRGVEYHTTVPHGHLWIEGDNPSRSRDSRQYGPVSLGLVKSRVLWRLTPNFGPVERRRIVDDKK